MGDLPIGIKLSSPWNESTRKRKKENPKKILHKERTKENMRNQVKEREVKGKKLRKGGKGEHEKRKKKNGKRKTWR